MSDETIIKTVNDILETKFENNLFKTLTQSSSFLDQIVIDISKEEFEKESVVKNILNLKTFIDQSLFEMRVRGFINQKIENKKKELKEMNLLDQKEEKQEQDLTNNRQEL